MSTLLQYFEERSPYLVFGKVVCTYVPSYDTVVGKLFTRSLHSPSLRLSISPTTTIRLNIMACSSRTVFIVIDHLSRAF